MKPESTNLPVTALASAVLDWRALVSWLNADGVINEAEVKRLHTRCANAESTQHPLMRLARVLTATPALDLKPDRAV